MQIIPIRSDFLHKVRQSGLDDQNQPVSYQVAQGGEPCRDVLRRARPGERIILASYCPFSVPGPYKEYGPIFVLAEEKPTKTSMTELPLPKGNPEDYLGELFVFRAYNEKEQISDATLADPANAAQALDRLLSAPETHFVLVRFAAYGCYALRIENDHQATP